MSCAVSGVTVGLKDGFVRGGSDRTDPASGRGQTQWDRHKSLPGSSLILCFAPHSQEMQPLVSA